MKQNSGRALRLKRLFRHNSERVFMVPMDHTVTDGPFATKEDYDSKLDALSRAGVDAVVLHKGRLRGLSEDFYRRVSVVVHVSASTKFAADTDDKYIIASVDDAVRRGADAISVHVNVGSATEARQLRDLADVADACERVGVPLLAMMYARGPKPRQGVPVEVLSHAASLAADLGADLVKLALPDDLEQVTAITAQSPIPVVAAGGAVRERQRFNQFVQMVVQGGAAGIAAGRNVFMADDVASAARETRRHLDSTTGLLDFRVLHAASGGGFVRAAPDA